MNVTAPTAAHASPLAIRPRPRHRTVPMSWPNHPIEPLEPRRLLSTTSACTCGLPTPTTPTAAATSTPAPTTNLPDLTAKITTLPKGSIKVSTKPKSVTAKVQITNAGTAPAKGKTTLNLYASFDQTLDPNDVLLASPKLNLNLKPKGKTTATVAFKVKNTTPSGTYFLIANVDPAGKIAESNETNNTAVSSKTVTVVNPAIPPGPHLTAAGLDSTSTTLLVGQPEQLALSATVTGQTPSTAMEVDEVDSSGAVLGKLTDLFDDGSGLHNDTTAADGAFNNTVSLSYDTPGTHLFVAKVTDPSSGLTQQTAPVTLSVIPAPSMAELQQVQDTNNAVGQQATSALAAGQSPSQVLDSVQATLAAMPAQVKPGSVQRTATAISWENSDGILSLVDTNLLLAQMGHTTASLALAGSQPAATPFSTDPVAPDSAAADQSPDPCKRAIVISPFNSLFASTDEATFIDGALTSKGWSVTPKINTAAAETSVDDFKNLGQYGAVVITSYGQDVPGTGEVIETEDIATTGDMLSHASDLFNKRLVTWVGGNGSSGFAITRRFIRTYAGRMDSSIVYVGHMGGLDDSDQPLTLSDGFILQGAKSFISYKTVSGVLTAGGADSLDTSGQGQKVFYTLLGIPDPLFGSTSEPGSVDSIQLLNETGYVQAVGDLTAKLPSLCRALSDYDLYVEYGWQTSSSRDLDTNTEFLGSTTGFSGDNDSPYASGWSDNVSGGGTEHVTLNLDQAYLDGKFGLGTPATVVVAHAGWYAPSMGSGPATLKVSLRNKTTGQDVDVASKTISPGSQSGLASTEVGDIFVALTGDPANPEVTITLT